MTALKGAEIEAFVAKPDPKRPVVLVFGPDSGLVHERATAIVRASVDDPADPFALARLESDDLSGDAARLADEAHTVPLFGGKRAVWLRVSGRVNVVPAVEALLAGPAPECRVVIEAGDLRRTAPLRALCERSKIAAALPCFVDGERDLGRLIDDTLRGLGLSIAPDARAALIPLLGGDRLASRRELEKLALYAMGKDTVGLDDIAAVVGDASALTLDALVDAVFAGRPPEVEAAYAKAANAGTGTWAILSAAARHAAQLHKARLAVDAGQPAKAVVERMIPPVHFSRQAAVAAALNAWSAPRLARAMQQLAEAVLESRKQAALADAITGRTLLAIAMAARRRD